MKSEGGTPVGSPSKWTREREGGGGGGGERGGGSVRQEQVLSSDEEAPITSVARPRQRSLRRRKYSLTNTPTSEQLVSIQMPVYMYSTINSCMYEHVCMQLKMHVFLRLKMADVIVFFFFICATVCSLSETWCE